MTIIYKKIPLIKITLNENINCVKESFTITKDLFDNISSKKRELLLEIIHNSENFTIMNNFGICRDCNVKYCEMDDKSVTVHFCQLDNLYEVGKIDKGR